MTEENYFDYYLSKMKDSPTDLLYFRYGRQVIRDISNVIKTDDYAVFVVKDTILKCNDIKGFRIERG